MRFTTIIYTYSYRLLIFLRHLLLPETCIVCGETPATINLCARCQASLPILPHNCYQCAQFLQQSHFIRLRCGACLQSPPAFDHIFPLFPYQPPIIQLIVQLKFQQKLAPARTFSELMLQKIKTEWYLNHPLPDRIIPMPLHNDRLKERGFNQAMEIARPLAKKLNIPLDYKSTLRVLSTKAQSHLAARARKKNVKHAFISNKLFTGQHLAVVDDVVTTAQTMREFCLMLKNQGASRIDIWCCARR